MAYIRGLPSSPCTEKTCSLNNKHVMELIPVQESPRLFNQAYSRMTSKQNKEEILLVSFSRNQPRANPQQSDLSPAECNARLYYSKVQKTKETWESLIERCDEQKDKDQNNVIILGNKRDKKGRKGLRDGVGYVYILVTTRDIYEDYYVSHEPRNCLSLKQSCLDSIEQSVKEKHGHISERPLLACRLLPNHPAENRYLRRLVELTSAYLFGAAVEDVKRLVEVTAAYLFEAAAEHVKVSRASRNEPEQAIVYVGYSKQNPSRNQTQSSVPVNDQQKQVATLYYSPTRNMRSEWVKLIRNCGPESDIYLGNRMDGEGNVSQKGLKGKPGYVYILVTTESVYDEYYRCHQPGQSQSLVETYLRREEQFVRKQCHKIPFT